MVMQMKTKTLHQSVSLKATAHDIYEALMDSNKHSEFTHSPAVIHMEVGGEFSAFDGWASGKTVELIPDKKIVQKWRGGRLAPRSLFHDDVRAAGARS
jgi:activator of HSP90 ATPase